MTTTDWHAAITTPTTLDEDTAENLLQALGERGPAISLGKTSHTLSITAHGDTAQDALTDALAALTAAGITEAPTAVTVQTYDALDEELAQPMFPDLVSNVEIAELAGVSRQRAAAFAKIPDFPAPVIQTGQGALRSRAAIEHWIAHRSTKPGPRARA